MQNEFFCQNALRGMSCLLLFGAACFGPAEFFFLQCKVGEATLTSNHQIYRTLQLSSYLTKLFSQNSYRWNNDRSVYRDSYRSVTWVRRCKGSDKKGMLVPRGSKEGVDPLLVLTATHLD